MKLFLCFIALLSFQLLNTSASTEINCDYTNIHYDVVGSIYICKVIGDLTITLKEEATITSASQDHFSSKNNDDVIGFVGDNKYMKYFPRGLEKVFKNLQLFHIRFTYIQELQQSDMKPFPELKELDLHDNEIRVLEDGLFDFNPKLVFLSFSSNKIFHIGLKVFDGLDKLAYLYLTSNSCIDKGTYLGRSVVLDIIEYSKSKCISSEYKDMDEQLNELENNLSFLEPEDFEDKVKNVETEFNSSSLSLISTLRDKLEKLKGRKLDELKRFVPSNPPGSSDGKTHKIILIFVIAFSIVIFGSIIFLFIRRN